MSKRVLKQNSEKISKVLEKLNSFDERARKKAERLRGQSNLIKQKAQIKEIDVAENLKRAKRRLVNINNYKGYEKKSIRRT